MKRSTLVLLLYLFIGISNAGSNVGKFTAEHTVPQLLGEQGAKTYASIVKPNETIQWNVFVPPSYDPSKPSGLMIYISPTGSGKIPAQWIKLMAQHNLIWIAARKSGNKIKVDRRMTYALLAIRVIQQDYNINPARIYLSGFSGGGRVASMLATQYPTLFKGGIYNCGANFWSKNNPPANISVIKENRYVFITGKNDFNLNDTKTVFRAYQNAGVSSSKLIISPHMGHKNPKKKLFGDAITYLDQR